jgi:16S rRNA (cytidine1402-2'-O)-methyltransferase
MGTLYLVATPIGNLRDITLRALDVLRAVPLIAAEDTRSARRLLDHFDAACAPSGKARLISYNEHNARARTPVLLDALAAGDVAVVSDAGTPGISDPGHHLVVAAIEAGHPVVPIPGASAVVAAVAASGLPSRRFHYLGFLPRQSGARRAALRAAAASGDTLVVYESPHRLRQTLGDVLAALGDRRIAVCRELTKRYEETWRGTVSAAIDRFSEPRGEFTLVIEGGAPAEAADAAGEDVGKTVAELRAAGIPSKEAVAELVRRCGLGRRAAYAAWHRAD